MSKATDILQAIKTAIDAARVVVQTTETDYLPLDEIVAEMVGLPANFPKAFIIFPAIDEEDVSTTLGSQRKYELPVAVDAFIVRDTSLLTEMDAVVKELRDIIETQGRLGLDFVIAINDEISITRQVSWNTTTQKWPVLFGAISIAFTVTYYYTEGDS